MDWIVNFLLYFIRLWDEYFDWVWFVDWDLNFDWDFLDDFIGLWD
jgi:hypothetical protein